MSIDELQYLYESKGGCCAIIREGTLNDDMMFYGDNLKTCIIKWKYQNEWSNYPVVKFYNKMPIKYQEFVLAN